jgi:bifunctional oligoribonuclease and PAP phosphatase NrnA
MVAEVLKKIEQHNDFVLTSHARPDGDAVGSILACYQILKSLGKNADVVLSDGVPFVYRPLPCADRVQKTNCVNGSYQAAIILECDSLQRTRIQGLERHLLINIDHHVSGRPFAHVNWIDPSACATAQLIYELARESGAKITPDIATCLYTAVLTDTGSFCFAGTNERTFALAQELVCCGADPARVAQNVYFSNPTSKMRLLGAALSNLQREDKLAWMWVSREEMKRCQAVEEDCEGLVNYALSISGVEAAAFFRELADGRFRVSLRSKGNVNVSTIAAAFHGGGHECASGCSLEGPLPAATEKILRVLRSALADVR